MQPLAQGALPEFGLAVNYIGVRYNNFSAKPAKLGGLDGLNVGIDHRHDGWGFDCAVRGFEAPDATGAGFVGYFEDWGHDGLNYDGGLLYSKHLV